MGRTTKSLQDHSNDAVNQYNASQHTGNPANLLLDGASNSIDTDTNAIVSDASNLLILCNDGKTDNNSVMNDTSDFFPSFFYLLELHCGGRHQIPG